MEAARKARCGILGLSLLLTPIGTLHGQDLVFFYHVQANSAGIFHIDLDQARPWVQLRRFPKEAEAGCPALLDDNNILYLHDGWEMYLNAERVNAFDGNVEVDLVSAHTFELQTGPVHEKIDYGTWEVAWFKSPGAVTTTFDRQFSSNVAHENAPDNLSLFWRAAEVLAFGGKMTTTADRGGKIVIKIEPFRFAGEIPGTVCRKSN